MKIGINSLLLGVAVCGGALVEAGDAAACGGFFCSQIQPVNQAAERIIFADNGDGTQTAVIEIKYEGPSEHFSWLLPISSVPQGSDLAVASDIAFQRLQSATNPQYTLTNRVEGTCKPFEGTGGSGGTSAGGPFPASGGEGGASDGGEVHVEASGVVGAFEWTVISVDPDTTNPEDAAVTWLNGNGFDVPAGANLLLRPYLADHLYLLALKLTKDSSVGSIRPISLTYAADRPSIPVKLTAVAANENMGVLTWVLGSSRAVPQNYLSLDLNEARINWFNPSSNYNAVVTAAADDAQGQGFVTELAAPTSTLAGVVWPSWEDARWEAVQADASTNDSALFDDTYYYYGAYDGFWDAVRTTVTLPSNVTLETFQSCPTCYSAQITIDVPAYLAALKAQVVDPVRNVQLLLDAHPQLTRLYTTMSAEEMTTDPLFTFNAELGGVSNIHNAERVTECNPDIYEYEAPWHIELPQGSTVRGTADDAASLTWPAALDSLAPNRLISRVGETGSGKVIEDNLDDINQALDAYNQTVPTPEGSGDAGTPGDGTGGSTAGKGGSGGTGAKGGSKASGGSSGKGGSSAQGGSKATGGTGGTIGTSGSDDGSDAPGGMSQVVSIPAARPGHSHGVGCSVGTSGEKDSALSGVLALLVLALRRRRSAKESG